MGEAEYLAASSSVSETEANSTGKNIYGMNGKTPNVLGNLARGRATKKILMEDPTYVAKIKKKLSESKLKFYKNGGVNGFKNKTHANEVKKLISLNSSVTQQGDKNSQYGSMWIYSTELRESKKILKTDKIPEGWNKGRVQDFSYLDKCCKICNINLGLNKKSKINICKKCKSKTTK